MHMRHHSVLQNAHKLAFFPGFPPLPLQLGVPPLLAPDSGELWPASPSCFFRRWRVPLQPTAIQRTRNHHNNSGISSGECAISGSERSGNSFLCVGATKTGETHFRFVIALKLNCPYFFIFWKSFQKTEF